MNKVGIIDWGIGGLSVYKELQKQIKSNSYVYLSDSGFTPYGKTKKKDLIKRLNKVLDFFRKQEISNIIIACNAASTVLNEVQSENSDLQLYGMLEAGKESILKSKKKSVLVLGGKRTIASQFFQKNFSTSKIKLQALVAQPLSALIESGQHSQKIFETEVLKLRADSTFVPEAVLLACTHYPAAENIFKKVFPKSKIIDPAEILVKNIKNDLDLSNTSKSKANQFFTTGSEAQSKLSAKKAFDLKIKKFHKISL
jgi:glutamate racemase